ncbi:MAG: DUF4976 domain-containing protein [Planctomycetota bacterium]|nr:MAG: DUF4976 domain-containing protein [Planctomycetota bacterium]
MFPCLLIAGLTVAVSWVQIPDEEVSAPRPNILFVYADDHAEAAIGAYGSRINQTPHLDRLAAQGMRFSQSFVVNSICGPARASILTGAHAHVHGRVNNRSPFRDDLPTWAKALQASGYQTAMIGKWHLPTEPNGFDFWAKTHGYYAQGLQSSKGKLERSGYTVDLITELGLEWIENREADKPFALWLCHNAAHRTWMPGPKHLKLYRGQTIPEPATLFDDYAGRSPAAALTQMRISRDLFPAYDLKLPVTGEQVLDAAATRNLKPVPEGVRKAWEESYGPENLAFQQANLQGEALVRWKYQRYIQDYLRCVAALDDSIGTVMEFLDQHGLADNTLVIYASDQGFFLGEHGWYDKRWMYEPALKTPMIARWPGHIQAGSVCDALVQNIDVAPTLMEVAGVKIPETVQGKSLRPWFQNQAPESWRDAIYYHYQEYDEGRIQHRVAKHCGIRTKRYKLIWIYQHDAWEFYDLQQDPDEMNNLYGRPEYQDRIQALTVRLLAMRKEFDDRTGPPWTD